MLADLEAETEQAVHQHAIVGHEFAAVAVEIEILAQRSLLGDEAVAPLVADRGGGDHAELAVAEHVEAGPGSYSGGEIDRQAAIALQQDEVGIAEFEQDRFLVDFGIVDRPPAVEIALQLRANGAPPVVEAEPVVAGAEIGVADPAGGFGVAADAAADLDEAFLRDGASGQIDHAAAEFAGIVGRIGLLHEAGSDDAGREDVERNHAAQRLRGGQGQAVKQGQRIAVAQAAHEDEAVADRGQAGDASQCAGDIAFAGSRDAGGVEDGDDLRRSATDILAPAARDDDGAAGDGDFGLFVLLLLRGVVDTLHLLRLQRIGCGILFCGDALCPGALRESCAGYAKRGGEQEQRSELLAGRHGSRPPHDQA